MSSPPHGTSSHDSTSSFSLSASSLASVGSDRVRLSHSSIWSCQDSFYGRLGLSSPVPNFVTTNACIARMYARIIIGFLNDVVQGRHAQQYDPSAPIYLVELGAGHGKLSFLILQQLLKLKPFWPTPANSTASSSSTIIPPPLFVYVLSDFTEEHVSFWRNHPTFAPLIDSGIVDFACVDAENPLDLQGGIVLQRSQTVLSRETISNPMFLLASYVFDTLRHDAFRLSVVKDSEGRSSLQLQEALLQLTSSQSYEPDITDPQLIQRCEPQWSHRDIAGASLPLHSSPTSSKLPADYNIQYYNGRDSALNAVLASLHTSLASSPLPASASSGYSVLVPLGALRCLDAFLSLSNGKLTVLVGDKAYNSLQEMHGLRDPHLAKHGSFSMMVNYDFIRRWIEVQGGAATFTPHFEGFKCALFTKLEGYQPASNIQPTQTHSLLSPLSSFDAASSSPSSSLVTSLLRDTALAFSEMEHFGPHAFATLQRSIRHEIQQPSLAGIVSLIQLSNYDADIFFKFRSHLISIVQAAYPAEASASSGTVASRPRLSEKLLFDLRNDLLRINENCYPLDASKDVQFELGRLAMALHDFALAAEFFQQSIKLCGVHQVTHYNLGLCLYYQGLTNDSLDQFDRSVELFPEYAEARHWRDRLRAQTSSNSSPNKSTLNNNTQANQTRSSTASVGNGGNTSTLPTSASTAAAPRPSLPFPTTTAAPSESKPPSNVRSSSQHEVLDTFVRNYNGYN